jgi:hypothetical protein
VACHDSFGVGLAKTYGGWYGGARHVVLVVSAWWGGVTVTLDARVEHETVHSNAGAEPNGLTLMHRNTGPNFFLEVLAIREGPCIRVGWTLCIRVGCLPARSASRSLTTAIGHLFCILRVLIPSLEISITNHSCDILLSQAISFMHEKIAYELSFHVPTQCRALWGYSFMPEIANT